MSVKTEAEFEKLKIIGRIVRKTLDQMAAAARSGMTTAELDELGQRVLAENGAEAAPAKVYGFPGAVCIKQVYVLRARDTLDRNDEDNLVFSGACDGLGGIRWDGALIRGIVDPAEAVVGVSSVRLKHFGANGEVRLSWTGR